MINAKGFSSLPLLFIFCVFTAVAWPSHGANPERNANRETRKLEPVPKEELSLQSLTDIYTACVISSLADEQQQSRRQLALGDLRRTCKDERANLAARVSVKGMNDLDTFFVTAYNNKQQEVQEQQ